MFRRYFTRCTICLCASVAELVDAADSKSAFLREVPVRVRPEAPSFFFFMRIALLFFFACLLLPVHTFSQGSNNAESTYDEVRNFVYQIRVIDKESGKKLAIGSGFQFTESGHIATNYHVIASAILYPESYYVEYLHHSGETGRLELLNIDIIHDLAITQRADSTKAHLSLGDHELAKGARIYSLGNPLDLGMTIVEGLYNGLLENTLYEKILLSAPINSGMSGGPAIDENNHVIGINVQTTGNDIGFLVPVDYLHLLYAKTIAADFTPITDWYGHIESEILTHQRTFIGQLISRPPEDWLHLKNFTLPGMISDHFKCWGRSQQNDEALHDYNGSYCSVNDSIYISQKLRTGALSYNYLWSGSRTLNPFQFYTMYSNWIKDSPEFRNAPKQEVNNFTCHDDFVDAGNANWKASFCIRSYKKYPQLFDAYVAMNWVDQPTEGMMFALSMQGVGKEESIMLAEYFMTHIQWTK